VATGCRAAPPVCRRRRQPTAPRSCPFRDYLRQHPDVANDYAALKRSLAEAYRDDRLGYTDAKSEFVAGVLRAAEAKITGAEASQVRWERLGPDRSHWLVVATTDPSGCPR
jgi:GrpB protein